MNEQERNAYSRGYNAGRRKNESDNEDVKRQWSEIRAMYVKINSANIRRRDAFFCAALTGILSGGGWKIGEQTGSDTQIEIAKRFADKAIEVMK